MGLLIRGLSRSAGRSSEVAVSIFSGVSSVEVGDISRLVLSRESDTMLWLFVTPGSLVRGVLVAVMSAQEGFVSAVVWFWPPDVLGKHDTCDLLVRIHSRSEVDLHRM